LDGHYRADREWTGGRLPKAEARLARWRAAVAFPAAPDARPLLTAVRESLANDLDTVGALATIDEWADAALANRGADPEAPVLARDMLDALLGVDL
jgi:L-cysteine:1D-myo-inositol 2-amino-2-deoxy-alpha-D-glucopyranoside ligase